MLCLICQDGMLCISFAPDAWNLSGHCQVTQDAQDAGDTTKEAADSGDAKDATQDAQDTGDTTQEVQDAGDAKEATQHAQDAGDADSTLPCEDATASYLTQGNLFLMLTPHPFTGLPQFICGCIHQMRKGASHLAAHISWRNRDSRTLCPFCEEDDESFQQPIILCPAKA